MKKGILMFATATAMLFASCAQTNVVKAEMDTAKQVRGIWTLSDVSYQNLDGYAVNNVFDMANPECYEGSTWNLVQNNKSGTYTFNNSAEGCPSGTANIIWNVLQDGTDYYFTFKDVTGIKAKQNTTGYRMKLDYVDANSMRFVQDVNAAGKIGQVIYTFQR